MRLAIKLLFAATAIPSAFLGARHSGAQENADATVARTDAEIRQDRLNLEYYVGSNVRWLVDRRSGVISAQSLDAASPLWSKDGIVFRATHCEPIPIKEVTLSLETPSRPAAEAFGRVYFFLDAPSRPNDVASRARYNALLVALDAKAQGRLAWKLNAQDFAPFFPPKERRELRFIDQLQSTANDELIIFVQSERKLNRFALDAATGRPRFLESFTISQ